MDQPLGWGSTRDRVTPLASSNCPPLPLLKLLRRPNLWRGIKCVTSTYIIAKRAAEWLFFHSEPLFPERKGLQPTWEYHHIQIRWWGQKANKLFRLRTGKRWYQKGESRRESPQKRVPLIHKTKTRSGHHGWGSRPFITRDLGREKYAPQIHDTINNLKSRTKRRDEWM